MLNKRVEKELNAQLVRELYSSYLYLQMAAYFESLSLKGFAHWMRIQEQEERMHAMKFYEFILERGGEIRLDAIDQPPQTWESPLKVFEQTMEHEQKVTAYINDLVAIAREEKDNATEFFLHWFVTEQVEEESSVDEILSQLKLIGDKSGMILMIDRELSGRPGLAAEGAQ